MAHARRVTGRSLSRQLQLETTHTKETRFAVPTGTKVARVVIRMLRKMERRIERGIRGDAFAWNSHGRLCAPASRSYIKSLALYPDYAYCHARSDPKRRTCSTRDGTGLFRLRSDDDPAS